MVHFKHLQNMYFNFFDINSRNKNSPRRMLCLPRVITTWGPLEERPLWLLWWNREGARPYWSLEPQRQKQDHCRMTWASQLRSRKLPGDCRYRGVRAFQLSMSVEEFRRLGRNAAGTKEATVRTLVLKGTFARWTLKNDHWHTRG